MTPPDQPSAEHIRQMFDRLACRYDLFNCLTSMGLDKRWRRAALNPLQGGMRVLDVGCGTGDLALAAMRKLGASGEVVGLDFSANMLSLAKERYRRLDLSGLAKHRFVLKRAEELPIEKEPFDLVVSGFVLRNLYENIDAVLKGVFYSLKSGGMISFLDITKPKSKLVAGLWKMYMRTVAALYGKILFGKDYPGFYLVQSAERFLNADEFAQKLEAAGFVCVRRRSFVFGIITLYQAVKP